MKGFILRIGSQRYEYSCDGGLLFVIVEYFKGSFYVTVRKHSIKCIEADNIPYDVPVSISFAEIGTSDSPPTNLRFEPDDVDLNTGLTITCKGVEYNVALEGGIVGLTISYKAEADEGRFTILGYADGTHYKWEEGALESGSCFEVIKTQITNITEPKSIRLHDEL